MNKIRETLKREMDKRRLSANKLAEYTNVPQPTISRILNGRTLDPETDTVKALADFFKLTVAEMRGEVDFKYLTKIESTPKAKQQSAKHEFLEKTTTEDDLLKNLSPESKKIVFDLIVHLNLLESHKK